MSTSVNLKLKRVRASFPALFKARAFNATQEPKFSLACILDKEVNADDIETIKEAIEKILEDENKGSSKGVKGCLRDGKEKADTDGYGPTVMFLNASNQKKVPIVDKDLTPLDADSGKPYAGCYCNVSIRLWWQDNDWGKRVNAQLRAVQFVADGEEFGDKSTDPEEVFEKEEDGDDAPKKGKGGKSAKVDNDLL